MMLEILASISISFYIITAILWTVFAIKMNTIVWNEKKLRKIAIFNLLFTPLAILLWISGGSEVIRKRLQVAKDIMEIKQKRKSEKIKKEKKHDREERLFLQR